MTVEQVMVIIATQNPKAVAVVPVGDEYLEITKIESKMMLGFARTADELAPPEPIVVLESEL